MYCTGLRIQWNVVVRSILLISFPFLVDQILTSREDHQWIPFDHLALKDLGLPGMETPSQFFHTNWSTPDDDSLRKNKEISIKPLNPTTKFNVKTNFKSL